MYTSAHLVAARGCFWRTTCCGKAIGLWTLWTATCISLLQEWQCPFLCGMWHHPSFSRFDLSILRGSWHVVSSSYVNENISRFKRWNILTYPLRGGFWGFVFLDCFVICNSGLWSMLTHKIYWDWFWCHSSCLFFWHGIDVFVEGSNSMPLLSDWRLGLNTTCGASLACCLACLSGENEGLPQHRNLPETCSIILKKRKTDGRGRVH